MGVECEREGVSEGIDERIEGMSEKTDKDDENEVNEESDSSFSKSETLYFSPSSSYDSTFYEIPDENVRFEATNHENNSVSLESTKDSQSISEVDIKVEPVHRDIPSFHGVCYGQFVKDTSSISHGELCDVIMNYNDRYIQLISPKKALNLYIPFNHICDVSLLQLQSITYFQVIVVGIWIDIILVLNRDWFNTYISTSECS